MRSQPVSVPNGGNGVNVGAGGRVVLFALNTLQQVIYQLSVEVNAAAEHEVTQRNDGPEVEVRPGHGSGRVNDSGHV